jgi:hypothetical protein
MILYKSVFYSGQFPGPVKLSIQRLVVYWRAKRQCADCICLFRLINMKSQHRCSFLHILVKHGENKMSPKAGIEAGLLTFKAFRRLYSTKELIRQSEPIHSGKIRSWEKIRKPIRQR